MCLVRLLFGTHFKLQVNNLISFLGILVQQEQYCPDLFIPCFTFSLGCSASGWLDKVCSLLHVPLILLPHFTYSFPDELSAYLVLSYCPFKKCNWYQHPAWSETLVAFNCVSNGCGQESSTDPWSWRVGSWSARECRSLWVWDGPPVPLVSQSCQVALLLSLPLNNTPPFFFLRTLCIFCPIPSGLVVVCLTGLLSVYYVP